MRKFQREAFDHALIGRALISLTGSWIKVIQSLVRLLSYKEDINLAHAFQDYTHPDNLDTKLAQLKELLDGHLQTCSMEKRYLHADGHAIWALFRVSLVRNEAGTPLYFVSHIKDITERKKNTEIIREQVA